LTSKHEDLGQLVDDDTARLGRLQARRAPSSFPSMQPSASLGRLLAQRIRLRLSSCFSSLLVSFMLRASETSTPRQTIHKDKEPRTS